MEAIKRVIKISKNHEIRIKVPEYVPENESVEVILILRKKPEAFKRKIKELKEAIKDSPFLEDLGKVSEDFKTVDLEGW